MKCQIQFKIRKMLNLMEISFHLSFVAMLTKEHENNLLCGQSNDQPFTLR